MSENDRVLFVNIEEIITALSLISIVLILVVLKAELEHKRGILSN